MTASRWTACRLAALVAAFALTGCVGGSATPSSEQVHSSTAPPPAVEPRIGADRSVVFARIVDAGRRELSGFWLKRPGLAARQVAAIRGVEINSAAVAPNGRLVAYVGDHVYGDGSSSIQVARISGGPPRVLAGDVALTSPPAWSPDSTRLVYTAWPGGHMTPFVYTLDVRSGHITRLTSHPQRVSDSQPVWSANGRSVLFSRHRHRGWRTLIVNASTRRIDEPPAVRDREVFDLEWQPGGRVIAGRWGESVESPLVLFTATGSHLRAVAHAPGGDLLGWSHDGRFLLISANDAVATRSGWGCHPLWTYDVRTGTLAKVACAGSAVWEPGVDRIVYTPDTWIGPFGINQATSVPLHSVAATGGDQAVVVHRSSLFALPALTKAHD